MAVYESIPSTCEAELYDGSQESRARLREFAGHWISANDEGRFPIITTPSGAATVYIGDYVCKAGDSDFYPCKPEVFNKRWREKA